jgi:hypothetical protein
MSTRGGSAGRFGTGQCPGIGNPLQRCGNHRFSGQNSGLFPVFIASFFRLYARMGHRPLTLRRESLDRGIVRSGVA